MKVYKYDIIKRTLGLFLVMALILPSCIQLLHAMDGHVHVSCTETTTHLHEKKTDCSLCDFNLSSFHFQTSEIPDSSFPDSYSVPDTNYISSEKNRSAHHFYLRGPPCRF